MKDKTLGKFVVRQVANGFTLSLVNPDYTPGKPSNGEYLQTTYVANTPDELAQQMVAHLVLERMEQP